MQGNKENVILPKFQEIQARDKLKFPKKKMQFVKFFESRPNKIHKI